MNKSILYLFLGSILMFQSCKKEEYIGIIATETEVRGEPVGPVDTVVLNINTWTSLPCSDLDHNTANLSSPIEGQDSFNFSDFSFDNTSGDIDQYIALDPILNIRIRVVTESVANDFIGRDVFGVINTESFVQPGRLFIGVDRLSGSKRFTHKVSYPEDTYVEYTNDSVIFTICNGFSSSEDNPGEGEYFQIMYNNLRVAAKRN
jgi:hypothetical protein